MTDIHTNFALQNKKSIYIGILITIQRMHRTANEYYEEGNEWRKKGNFQMAQNCYLEAVALDPDSPAAIAMEMLDDIQSFYHKDYYNP